MKTATPAILVILCLSIHASLVVAQPPRGGRDSDQRSQNWDRPPGPDHRGPGGFLPPNPFFQALDTDDDDLISAEELENASESLKALDKNKDGKISMREGLPQFGIRGGGQFGPAGPPGPRGERDRRHGSRRFEGGGGPDRGPDGFGPPGPPPRRPDRPDAPPRPDDADADVMPPFISAFVERIMSRDADGDGKVTKDELPDRAQQMFDRADRNEDGVLEEGELRQAAQWMRRRLGEGGGRGPRPERPARPPVEENDEA